MILKSIVSGLCILAVIYGIVVKSRKYFKEYLMGTAIDLFVTYRFIKLLVTPFNKTEAFKLGIIDDKGIRQVVPGTNKPTTLATIKERNAYTVLHKLVFNIKRRKISILYSSGLNPVFNNLFDRVCNLCGVLTY